MSAESFLPTCESASFASGALHPGYKGLQEFRGLGPLWVNKTNQACTLFCSLHPSPICFPNLGGFAPSDMPLTPFSASKRTEIPQFTNTTHRSTAPKERRGYTGLPASRRMRTHSLLEGISRDGGERRVYQGMKMLKTHYLRNAKVIMKPIMNS